MVISSKFLSYKIWQNLFLVKVISKEAKASSSFAHALKQETISKNDDSQTETQQLSDSTMQQSSDSTMQQSSDSTMQQSSDSTSLLNHRFIYPEFLPDPNPLYRNSLREKLERIDMLARRSVISIPEFYVGSILAVTYSEPHAPEKVNRFVGICILREGSGLRASFILRNVVDSEGIEVRYNLYDPALQKIECLKLEKRLDNELLYLRDAPLEYSTFPFDMEKELSYATSVPVNKIKIPLKEQKWLEKWERKNLKGVKDLIVSEKHQIKAKAAAKPWEKYDLMKRYRESIPSEEQIEIFSELQMELNHLEIKKKILKHKRTFKRPKKQI